MPGFMPLFYRQRQPFALVGLFGAHVPSDIVSHYIHGHLGGHLFFPPEQYRRLSHVVFHGPKGVFGHRFPFFHPFRAFPGVHFPMIGLYPFLVFFSGRGPDT